MARPLDLAACQGRGASRGSTTLGPFEGARLSATDLEVCSPTTTACTHHFEEVTPHINNTLASQFIYLSDPNRLSLSSGGGLML